MQTELEETKMTYLKFSTPDPFKIYPNNNFQSQILQSPLIDPFLTLISKTVPRHLLLQVVFQELDLQKRVKLARAKKCQIF